MATQMAPAYMGNGSMKKCAFCKHWYDPTNSAIRIKNASKDYWEYDRKAKNIYREKGFATNSYFSCPQFELKI